MGQRSYQDLKKKCSSVSPDWVLPFELCPKRRRSWFHANSDP